MMPLGRYFFYVGGLLLALLFVVDWYAPPTAASAGEAAPIDRSIIRIHSAHRWPTAVVFDTTQPTIVPPEQAAVAEAVPAAAPVTKSTRREALAMAQAVEVPASVAAHAAAPKQVKRRIRPARPVNTERVASYEPFGFRPLFAPGW